MKDLLLKHLPHEIRISSVLLLIDIHEMQSKTYITDILSEYMIEKVDELSSVIDWDLYNRHIGITLIKLTRQRGIPVGIDIFQNSADKKYGFIGIVAALILAFIPNYDLFSFDVSVPSDLYYNKYEFLYSYILYPQLALSRPKTLNSSQEKVLEAIANNDWIWNVSTNIFDVFDLPDRREELASLL